VLATHPTKAEPSIKVGDTVERVEGEYNGMKVGDTATVSQVDNFDALMLREFEGTHNPDNFKVVSSQEEQSSPTEQNKTVADAWEWHKKTYGTTDWRGIPDALTFEMGKWFFCYTAGQKGVVCTRKQFETYGREQEGEKWTHTTSLGKCRVLIDTPDKQGYVVVELDNNAYAIVPPRCIKPIKPTLTKAQAWDMVQDYEGVDGIVKYILELHSKYDITD
jgi:transcription antitermination factor NusG